LLRHTHEQSTPAMTPNNPALSRWPCSSRIITFSHQPAGLSDPLLSGQSGNAMPAPLVVV
jgi:hypothetical protein